MIDSSSRLTITSLAAIFLGCSAALAAGNGETPVFQFPQDRDICFVQHGIHCCLLVFRKDGSYERRMCCCGGDIVRDRGTWKQNEEGVIEYRSAMRLRNVRCGNLTVWLNFTERDEALKTLEADMRAFLANTDANSFSSEELKKALTYPDPLGSKYDDKTRVFSPIRVTLGVDSVSRRELEALLRAWKRYFKSDAKNVFHARAIVYRNTTFLVSKDDSSVECTNLDGVRKQLDLWDAEPKHAIFLYRLMPDNEYKAAFRAFDAIMSLERSPEPRRSSDDGSPRSPNDSR